MKCGGHLGVRHIRLASAHLRGRGSAVCPELWPSVVKLAYVPTRLTPGDHQHFEGSTRSMAGRQWEVLRSCRSPAGETGYYPGILPRRQILLNHVEEGALLKIEVN